MGSCCGKPESDEEELPTRSNNDYTDRLVFFYGFYFCVKNFKNWFDLKERLRELQAQAAEKRMRENEAKGIKNLEKLIICWYENYLVSKYQP